MTMAVKAKALLIHFPKSGNVPFLLFSSHLGFKNSQLYSCEDIQKAGGGGERNTIKQY